MNEARLSHQESWELLPWLANGTLDPEEAARVEEHLAACTICRAELRACRELAASLSGAGAGALDPDAGIERVMARIEAAEAATPGRRRLGALGRLAGRWRGLLAASPRPVRAALAVQGAIACAALVSLALFAAPRSPAQLPSPDPAPFRTLSTPAAPAPAEAVRLRLVFAEGVTEVAVRELLVDAGARIVDGPSAYGVYTVELSADSNADSNRGAARPEGTVERLAAHPAVRFAEPAVAAPPSLSPPRRPVTGEGS